MRFLDFARNDKKKLPRLRLTKTPSPLPSPLWGEGNKGIYIMIAIFVIFAVLAVAGVEKTKRGLDHSLQIVREEKRLFDEQQVKMFEKIPAVVTAYSSTEEETDDTPHITATGKAAGFGAIAVDPSEIPMGSMIFVPGYGWGEAIDIGGKIKGRMIDIWMEPPEKAKKWGKRVEIIIVVRPEFLKMQDGR